MSAIKIVHDGTTRRFLLEDPSYCNLKQKIQLIFNITHCSLKYKDEDGDMCTVSSDPELEEAFRLAKEDKKTLKLQMQSDVVVQEQEQYQEEVKEEAQEEPQEPLEAKDEPQEHEEEKPEEAKKKAKAQARTQRLKEARKILELFKGFLENQKICDLLPRIATVAINAIENKDNSQTIFEKVLAISEDVRTSPFVQALLKHLPKIGEILDSKLKKMDPIILTYIKVVFPQILDNIIQQKSTIIQVLSQILEQWGSDDLNVDIDCGNIRLGNGNALKTLLPMLNSMSSMLPGYCPFTAEFAGFTNSQSTMSTNTSTTTSTNTSTTTSTTSTTSSTFSPNTIPINTPVDHGSNQSVHINVSCDGCNMFPIIGTRFKCLDCDDYDLCEPCESSESSDHPSDHAMMQYKNPKNEYVQFDTVHNGITCDGCEIKPIIGGRFKCSICPDYDLCESCNALGDKHDPNHPLVKMKVPNRGFQIPSRRHGGFRHIRGGFRHHHRGRGGSHGHCRGRGKNMQRNRNVCKNVMKELLKEKSKKCAVKFLKDLTVPHKSFLVGGSQVLKTWQVQNISTEKWVEGTKLIFIRGDREVSSEEEFAVPCAGPGEVVEVSVLLSVPEKAGSYLLKFQLASPDRVVFGPRLTCKFSVIDNEDSKENISVSGLPVAPVVDKWRAPKSQIRGMGFNQSDEQLEALLVEKKGNVTKVVEALTSTSCYNG